MINLKKNNRKWFWGVIAFIFIAYISIDQHRYFLHDKNKKNFITVWKRFGFNDCYIIPGKYYSIFPPSKNYIRTTNRNNYLGIIWNSNDEYRYKISLFNKFKVVGLEEGIKVYKSNDDMLIEHNILDSIGMNKSKYYYNKEKELYRKIHDYEYILLNGLLKTKVLYSSR